MFADSRYISILGEVSPEFGKLPNVGVCEGKPSRNPENREGAFA